MSYPVRRALTLVLLGVLGVGAAIAPAQESQPSSRTDDLAALLAGIDRVASPGVPGPLALFGDAAFPVLAAREGDVRAPVVAAARMGRGRVVAFGHGGYFGREALAEGTTARLVANAVRWAGAGRSPSRVVAWRAAAVRDALAAFDVSTTVAEASSAADVFAAADVVVCDIARLRDVEDARALGAFVASGGGVVAASLGWGWLQTNPGRTLARDHLGNVAFAAAGLGWADGTADDVLPADSDAASLATLHGGAALGRLVAADRGIEPAAASRGRGRRGAKSDAEAALIEAAAAVERAAATTTSADLLFRPRLTRALEGVADVVPTASRPLGRDRPLARVKIRLARVAEEEAAPSERRADPSAAAFPGAVPADAAEIPAEIRVAAGRAGWVSTGRYAAPGRAITVRCADPRRARGWRVRIGAHTDELWHLDAWRRHPDVSRSDPLTGETTVVVSPFGGLVFLEPPRDAAPADAVFVVEGGVVAPRFVRGATTLAEWRDALRGAPAPWAELETSKIVLVVPSGHVRGLDDPESLLELWDRVLDLYADLGARPLGPRAERIVADEQISAGYMHSGYPIMTHLDAAALAVDAKALVAGGKGWGFWHEIGHNHQKSEWTFEGTGEVTCNLFSLYVVEKIGGQRPWDALRERRALPKAARHLKERGGFAAWKADPFLALVMYGQVIEAFGWDAIRSAFAAYRDAPPSERPKDDAAKRDAWLRRLSTATGRDLGPFFEAWGVPTSEAARAATAGLPAWTPPAIE